jgi:uncharacterized protein (TIGR01777 family)
MTDTTLNAAKMHSAPRKPLRIVLIGGSGHVGTLLAGHFHQPGNEVCVIARTTFSAPWRVVAWDGLQNGGWVRALDGADVVINLAGRSVNCRYNGANKAAILASRVRSTSLVGGAIQTLSKPPSVWLNASTATIYRHATDRAMDEQTGELGGAETNVPDTWRFSIEVATRWEEDFFHADTPKTRKVALRSAMMMSPDRGGVFDALLRLVRFGIGGRFGSGQQYVSWVHETDFVRAVEFLIANEHINGVVNVASPNPLTNADFMRSLRDAWGTRIGLPATEWMLEVGAFFLRTETELILKSRRVVPGRLLGEGFTFEFPEWREAAKELVARWRQQRTGGSNL